MDERTPGRRFFLRPKGPEHLREPAFKIFEVPRAERNDGRIKSVIGKLKVLGISRPERNGTIESAAYDLRPPAIEHLFGNVDSDHFLGAKLHGRKRKISSAGCNIKNGKRVEIAKVIDRPAPPEIIGPAAQHMVEKSYRWAMESKSERMFCFCTTRRMDDLP